MIIHDCEQRSEEWYKLRVGMPTASEFSKLVTSAGTPSKSLPKYAITLAGEAFAGGPLDAWQGNSWMEHGRETEAEAISLYEFAHDLKVVPVGFVTNNGSGCSPDGFVGDDGIVEVKCLKAERHIEAILYFQKNNRPPTAYVQQTQGQMMICERQWCDLVFYQPELPLLVIRETPIKDVVEGLAKQLKAVIVERNRVLASLNLFKKAA